MKRDKEKERRLRDIKFILKIVNDRAIIEGRLMCEVVSEVELKRIMELCDESKRIVL